MKSRRIPLLAFVFGALVALNIFLSACVFVRTTALERRFAEAERRYHSVSNLLLEIRSDIYASMFAFQRYLLAPGSDSPVHIQGELEKVKQSSERHLTALKEAFPAAQEVPQLMMESVSYWNLLRRGVDPANAAGSLSQRLLEGNAALEQALRATRDIDSINAAELSREQLELERDDRSFGHFLFWLTSLNVLVGVAVSLASLTRLRALERQNEAEREKIQRAEFDLRHLSQQLVKAQEEERKNISRELHDEIGQLLTGLRIELGNLQRSKDDQQIAEGRLAEAKTLAEKALRTVRNMAMLLRPSMLDDQGLAPALRWQAREFSRRFDIPVTVELGGDVDRVPAGHAICLYRVVQEALTNCARHAQARHIRIYVNVDDSNVAAFVEDDGVGFKSRSPQSSGVGLLGAAERVRELGGTFLIDSEAGRGTRVNIEIPVPKTELT